MKSTGFRTPAFPATRTETTRGPASNWKRGATLRPGVWAQSYRNENQLVISRPEPYAGTNLIGGCLDKLGVLLLAGAMAAGSCQASAIVAVNFAGPSLSTVGPLNGGNFAPSDMGGAAGPNNVVQFINGAFTIYNRTGGIVSPTITDTQFWRNGGISAATVNAGLSDTRLIYDTDSQRWFAVEINVSSTNKILVARSNWYRPHRRIQGSGVRGQHRHRQLCGSADTRHGQERHLHRNQQLHDDRLREHGIALLDPESGSARSHAYVGEHAAIRGSKRQHGWLRTRSGGQHERHGRTRYRD